MTKKKSWEETGWTIVYRGKNTPLESTQSLLYNKKHAKGIVENLNNDYVNGFCRIVKVKITVREV